MSNHEEELIEVQEIGGKVANAPPTKKPVNQNDIRLDDLSGIKPLEKKKNSGSMSPTAEFEERYDTVPFFPPNNNIPDDIYAKFEPGKNRLTEPYSNKPEGETREDDPRKTFDNNPSDLPWDDTGRFESKESLLKLVNKGGLKDSKIGIMFGVFFTIITGGGYLLAKRRAIGEGKFRIVKKSLHHEIRLEGHHTLLSATAKWKQELELDDESKNIVRIGNRSIVNIPSCYIGTAYLVGNKKIYDSEGNVQIVKDKDVVLFSQGSYVLDESAYRKITVTRIDPDQKVINSNNLPITVMQIGEDDIGIARKKSTQKYHIYQSGAPILFDNKEFCDFQVVRRTTNTFILGPYTFLTLLGREIASVTKKDGTSILLTKKGTYQFHNKVWNSGRNQIVKVENGDNVDVGEYFIRTIDENFCATVKNLKTGKYYIMPPGKYHLEKRIWQRPDIRVFDKPLVRSGPYWFLRVQKDFATGAMNVRTGEFEEFNETGKVHILHVKEFPKIERIERVNFKVTPFGPYTFITIKDGSYGVFEEKGEIRIENSGTYKLSPGTKVLQSLPARPQFVQQKLSFTTKDRFELSGMQSIQFELTNPKQVAQELRSREDDEEIESADYSVLINEMKDRSCDAMKRMLRTKMLYELSSLGERKKDEEKNDIATNVKEMCMETLKEMKEFSENTKIGISFTSIEIIGGFELVDRRVKEKFAKLAQLELEGKVQKDSGRVQKEKERIETEIKKEKTIREKELAISKADTQKEVLLKEKEAELEIKKKEIENDKLLQKTKLALDLERSENDVKKRDLLLQQQIKEKQQLADSEAYSIKTKADAENYRDTLKNKLTKDRPQILNELEKMKIMVDFAREYGKSAWNNEEMMKMLSKKVNFQFGDFLMWKDMQKPSKK